MVASPRVSVCIKVVISAHTTVELTYFALVCCRMQKAGIPCPTVALLKKHILVMSFIGKDQKPTPKLKDAVLSSRQLQQAYQQCVQVLLQLWSV